MDCRPSLIASNIARPGLITLALVSVSATAAADMNDRLLTAGGDRLETVATLDRRGQPEPVTVCLHNQTDALEPVGFDLAEFRQPRFLVPRQQFICGRFAPLRQSFSLWRVNTSGHFWSVLRLPLKLDQRRMRRIDLYWWPARGKRR
jgi:hypothetical protein